MNEITFYLKDKGNNKFAFKGESLPFGVILTKKYFINSMGLNTFILKNKAEDMLLLITRNFIY